MITAPDLTEVVECAITMMLGIDAGVAIDSATPAEYCAYGASVGFTGDWNGVIVIACDETMGREAAGAMFGTAPSDVASDDVADAIGELANVIGGNLKSLLPG